MQTEDNCQSIDTEESQQDSRQTTLGELLTQARSQQGLSEKDVADKLHITMHYVRAIEANKFEKLPGAVFAKGYIKNYALLLGLNADEIAATFDELNSASSNAREEISRRQIARRRSDRNKPWVYVSVGCFIVGFALLWVYNHYFSDASNAPLAAPVTRPAGNMPATGSPTIASRPIAQAEGVSALIPQSSASTLGASSFVAAEPDPNTVASELTVVSSAPIQLQQSTSTPASSIADTAPTVTAPLELVAIVAAAADPETENRVIEVDSEGDDVLRISFSGESWIEVNDSESRQIYRDIREAGDVLEITGSAPFNVLLGDAPFTSLTLNGAEIDVSDNIRIDNSARLTVGL